MLRACIAAVIIGCASGAMAQTRADTYRQAVTTYQAGDFDGAARAITNWNAADLKAAIGGLTANGGDWRRFEAAAMLHTDLVVLERETSEERIALQLALAEGLVARLTPLRTLPGLPEPAIAAFQERWYELGASVYLAMTAPLEASEIIDRGLRAFKRSARLIMYRGIVDEMRGHIADGDFGDASVLAVMASTPARRGLVLAASRYRDALAIDPTLIEARLRLGRVLTLLREFKTARQELEAAEAAQEPRVKHLARLFLGALSEYEHDWPAARDRYTAALLIFPTAQSALVALSYVDALTGHEAEARLRVADLGTPEHRNDPDPWSDYQNGGLSQPIYEWLVAHVREPR